MDPMTIAALMGGISSMVNAGSNAYRTAKEDRFGKSTPPGVAPSSSLLGGGLGALDLLRLLQQKREQSLAQQMLFQSTQPPQEELAPVPDMQIPQPQSYAPPQYTPPQNSYSGGGGVGGWPSIPKKWEIPRGAFGMRLR